MKTRWIRTPASRKENAAAAAVAGALAGAVGVAAFYLVRTFLAREPLEPPAADGDEIPGRSGGDA